MFSFKPPSHYSRVVFLKKPSIFQDTDCCFLKPLGIFTSEAREGVLSWTDIINCLNRTVAPFETFHSPHTYTPWHWKLAQKIWENLHDLPRCNLIVETTTVDYDGNSRILFVLTARWTPACPNDQLTLVKVHSTLSLLSFTSHFLKTASLGKHVTSCSILPYQAFVTISGLKSLMDSLTMKSWEELALACRCSSSPYTFGWSFFKIKIDHSPLSSIHSFTWHVTRECLFSARHWPECWEDSGEQEMRTLLSQSWHVNGEKNSVSKWM